MPARAQLFARSAPAPLASILLRATGMIVVTAVLVVVWLAQLILALRVIVRVPAVDTLPPGRMKTWPKLSLIVPARDEGAQIESALASKLACGYPALELVAVDDRSADQTGKIMDRAAADDDRVRVVHLDVLPAGWLGKLHAMKAGLELATGEWVLFSDADVHLEPGTLERLIAHAEEQSIDFIAVFPRMNPVNPIVDGLVAALLRLLALGGRVWKANDDRSHIGAGVGAFNLVRRRLLETTGAIDELRMEVADDVALGSLLKQSGARCRFFAGRSSVHLVFLDSLRAAARSVDKGGGICGFSIWKGLLIILAPISVELLLPLAAIFAGGLAQTLGLIALGLATATHVAFAAHFLNHTRGAFLWPLGQVLNVVLTMRSLIRASIHQGVWWRDTFYSRAVLESGRRLQFPSLRVTRTH